MIALTIIFIIVMSLIIWSGIWGGSTSGFVDSIQTAFSWAGWLLGGLAIWWIAGKFLIGGKNCTNIKDLFSGTEGGMQDVYVDYNPAKSAYTDMW